MQRHFGGIEPAPGTAREPVSRRVRRLAGRIGLPVLLHGLLVALVAGLALWRPAALEDRVEGPLVDLRFRARNAWVHFRTNNDYGPPAVPRIVIVAVDQASVDHYGSWPWPESRVAELIENIVALRPKTLGIYLPRRDLGSPWDEARVARAFANLPGGAVVGHTAARADSTGKVRHERLYARAGGALIPSFALRTALVAAGLPPEALRVREDGGVDFGGTAVPTDRRGRMAVNYYGGDESFPRYSAAGILRKELDPAKVTNAVVFVGGAADTAVDFVGTPFAEFLPAIEKDATIAANILAGDFLRESTPAKNLLIVLAAGLAVPLLLRRRAVFSLLCLIGAALVLIAYNFALFVDGTLLTLALPLLVLVASGGAAVVRQHLAAARGVRQVRRLFSSYVTERVVERLIADPTLARPGGERREVTVLFADIRGFTGFAERHSPEEVVRTLNEYLEAMTEVVFRWEGTVDKFIGDTILAFWGAPLPQEDHAERALRCALHLCRRLDRLNAAWAAAGRPAFEIGIGISTGQVLVGNIGAEGKKMDYTVIGDQVNICSRVEELTKDFGARILVTAGTFAQLRPAFAAAAFGHVTVESLAPVPVKGKEERVRVYRVSPQRHGVPARVAGFAALAPGA